MGSPSVAFGSSFRNQIGDISKHVEEGIQSLQQFRDFARERNTIEREYAQKLENLARRFKTKSLYKISSGDSEWDDPTSTYTAAWSTLLDQTELNAKIRSEFVRNMNVSVIETLKATFARKEDARKKHIAFIEELKLQRDRACAEKDKAKHQYDESCMEIEKSRARLNKGGGDQEKYSKQLQQAFVECGNKKNTYILSLAMANVSKAKYFEEDIPTIVDHLQTLDETRILAFQDILQSYIQLEIDIIAETRKNYDMSLASAARIDAENDARAFIKSGEQLEIESELESDDLFTFVPWNGGQYAPEAVIDRNGGLTTSESAFVILNNKLIKDRKHLDILGDDLSRLSSEMLELKKGVNSISNKGSCKYDEAMDRLMEVIRRITIFSSEKVRVKSEIDIIIQSIGDGGLRAPVHDFSPSSFAIPISCDFCQSKIWGTSKQGLKCKACGFCCHTKCEMSVQPNCSQIQGVKNGPQPIQNLPSTLITTEQQDQTYKQTTTELVSDLASEPLTDDPTMTLDEHTTIRVQALYYYKAQSADELSIQENEELLIASLEDSPDWVKAYNKDGGAGLIPANYVAPIDSTTEFARVLYDFEAVNSNELDIREGDEVMIIKKDNTGWLEGHLNGRTGIFPTSYVEVLKK